MPSNIYRRGAIYWWRRTVRFVSVSLHPTIVRMSLRTAVLSDARTRAAWLEMELGQVEQNVKIRTTPGLGPSDLAAIYQLAARSALDRYLVLQCSTPWRSEEHSNTNLAHARYFTMMASAAEEPRPGFALGMELASQGLPPEEIYQLQQAASYYANGSAINPAYVAAYLREAGCSATPANIAHATRIVAAGYRTACINAQLALGEPDPSAQLPDLPLSVRAVLQDVAEPLNETSPRPVDSNNIAFSAGSRPHASRIDCRISELAEAAVDACIADEKWSQTCRGDVSAATKLFIAANGDLQLSAINQQHLSNMAALFSKLPRVYGKLKRGGTRENPIWETLEEALDRGAQLRIQWDQDPVVARKAGMEEPGLSVTTRNKHLQWIEAIFGFAAANGYVEPAASPKLLRRKDKRAPNKKRRSWDLGDLKTLISGPVWAGCAGIHNRLEPGAEIIHDGMYWAPLLLVAHATRSEETNGLMLDDIVDDASTPYIRYCHNAYRRTKNHQSERCLPIPQRMIEMGFLDYVRALREAGEDLLFPELWNPQQGFDKAFRDKVFYPLKKHHFPEGTSRLTNGKDVDVHSIRATGLTQLHVLKFGDSDRSRFAGHTPAAETDLTYTDDAAADHFVPMVEALWRLLPPIPQAPICLRPAEFRKFGSPRGRRAKT
jgi:integrase